MEKGTVIKSTGSWYSVLSDDKEIIQCRIKGKFRLNNSKSTNPIAVGDRIGFEIEPTTGDGVIAHLYERKNYIIRKSTNLSKQTHILASNIDQAVLLATINFPITTNIFIDRFIVSAEAYNIPVILIFNKSDRYDERHKAMLSETIRIYEKIGYQTLTISAKQGENVDSVKELLKNKTTLVAGHSGVGKSTLINKLEPGLNLKTKEISEQHQTGRHTTTFAEMHPFSFGGYIIDSPGIRGFGITQIEKEELSHYFKEIFHISKHCQFHNCTHIHEPNCAVREAVKTNEIAETRYLSYTHIYLNKEDKYR